MIAKKEFVARRPEVETFADQFALSPRERDVLQLVLDGTVTADAIGDKLELSPNTVKNHFKSVLQKTGTKGKTDLLAKFTREMFVHKKDSGTSTRIARILIVDDEEEFATTLAENLAYKWYRVFSATSPDMVLEEISALHIDVVVMDVRMPNINGIEMLRRIRSIYPMYPIVILMTGSETVPVDEVMDFGAADFLRKPFALSDVEAVIRKHFSQTTQAATSVHDAKDTSLRICAKTAGRGSEMKFDIDPAAIGFGGAFVPMTPEDIQRAKINAGDDVGLDIQFSRDQLACRGRVMWVRHYATGGLMPGLGIRFEDLSSSIRDKIEMFVRAQKTVSYVPRGLSKT